MKIVRLEDAKEWPEARSLSPEDLMEAYALARAAFTADDLQKFTEVDEEPISMEAFLAELEKAQKEHDENILATGEMVDRIMAEDDANDPFLPEFQGDARNEKESR